MKKYSFFWRNKVLGVTTVALLMSSGLNAQGIKVRPSTASSESPYVFQSPLSAAEMQKAYDADESSYTNLATATGLGVTTTPYMNLSFSSDVPAKRPFFAKIEMNDATLLNNVVGGVVGNALGDILSGLIGGIVNNQFYLLDSGGNEVFSAETRSFGSVDPNKLRFVQDSQGNYYARFQIDSPFRTFKTRLYSVSIINLPRYTRYYDTFYYSNNSTCLSKYTYINASQDLLTAVSSSAPVTNPKNVIDNDLNSYASFGNQGLLQLGLGKTIEQVIELPAPTTTKKVQVKLMLPSALLNVGVGSGVKMVFYKGYQELKTVDIDRSILSVDLLGLINSNQNQAFTVTIDPPTDANGNILEYDKVGLKLTQPVNLGVGSISGDLRLYDLSFVDKDVETTYACGKVVPIAGGGFEKKFDITQIIPGFSTSNYAQYSIATENNTEIVFTSTADIETKKWQPFGRYLIRGISAANYCSDEFYTFYIQENQSNSIEGNSSILVPVGQSVDFASLSYTSNVGNTIQIFDESNNNNVTSSNIAFNTIGTYNYYVKASNTTGSCEVVKRIKVYVYDAATCDYRYMKRMATSESVGTVSLLGIPLGGSYYSANAVDDDLSTFSQIFNAVSLLGIGTTWQDLKFDSPIPAGTPLTVKLGQGYSLAQVIGGITFRPLDAAGQPIGYLKDIGETDLLNALVGDNVFEFTFVPTDNSGDPISYSGVRVHLGSLLGLANKIDIYGAYVEERVPVVGSTCEANVEINGATLPVNITSDPPNGHVFLNSTVQDVLWGIKDPGIGAATSLSGVVYPYLAADEYYEYSDNGTIVRVPGLDSYAIFNTAASVLNTQSLTVKLKEPTRPGDQLRIILGSQNVSVLNLSLLGGFKIQRYYGDAPVGAPLTNSDFNLVNLNLLGLLGDTSDKYAILVQPSNIPFDRVEISYTNVASVQLLGEYTYIYDVAVIPAVDLSLSTTGLEMCTDKVFELPKNDVCSTYNVSFVYKRLAAGSTQANPIYEWVEITGSALQPVYANDTIFRYRIPYTSSLQAEYNTRLSEILDGVTGTLYLKVGTLRQGCLYGDAVYYKVSKVGKCHGMISNPHVRSSLKPY